MDRWPRLSFLAKNPELGGLFLHLSYVCGVKKSTRLRFKAAEWCLYMKPHIEGLLGVGRGSRSLSAFRALKTSLVRAVRVFFSWQWLSFQQTNTRWRTIILTFLTFPFLEIILVLTLISLHNVGPHRWTHIRGFGHQNFDVSGWF